jgi:hypothetical protein
MKLAFIIFDPDTTLVKRFLCFDAAVAVERTCVEFARTTGEPYR